MGRENWAVRVGDERGAGQGAEPSGSRATPVGAEPGGTGCFSLPPVAVINTMMKSNLQRGKG